MNFLINDLKLNRQISCCRLSRQHLHRLIRWRPVDFEKPAKQKTTNWNVIDWHGSHHGLYLLQTIVDDIVQCICGRLRYICFCSVNNMNDIVFIRLISRCAKHVNYITWNAIIISFAGLNPTIGTKITKFRIIFFVNFINLSNDLNL